MKAEAQLASAEAATKLAQVVEERDAALARAAAAEATLASKPRGLRRLFSSIFRRNKSSAATAHTTHAAGLSTEAVNGHVNPTNVGDLKAAVKRRR